VVTHKADRYYLRGESLRILVVEDETKVARALQEGLERQQYEVVVAGTGEEGFYLVSAEEFDLVILDLMLPGRDGLQVLGTLRKRGLVTPVLILTARDAIEDRVQGLDKGADDYLVKPFAFPELLARVRALLRRGRTQQVALRLQLADLEMDLVPRRVRRGGKDVECTTSIPGTPKDEALESKAGILPANLSAISCFCLELSAKINREAARHVTAL